MIHIASMKDQFKAEYRYQRATVTASDDQRRNDLYRECIRIGTCMEADRAAVKAIASRNRAARGFQTTAERLEGMRHLRTSFGQ